MRTWKLVVTLAGALALTGCATAFYGTAPSADGQVYVSGQHSGNASVWKCPATGKGECKDVNVELK